MKANFSEWSIYPLEGNHDFGNANCQDFATQDPMIAFNMEQWSQWLDADALQEYSNIGYYSQKLKTSDGTVYDKVRVVAVTSQPCYNWNFYLWQYRDDPGGELDWLNQTLYQMEQNGETAILISHVPPGGSACLY